MMYIEIYYYVPVWVFETHSHLNLTENQNNWFVITIYKQSN